MLVDGPGIATAGTRALHYAEAFSLARKESKGWREGFMRSGGSMVCNFQELVR